jgi:hypothetical protein
MQLELARLQVNRHNGMDRATDRRNNAGGFSVSSATKRLAKSDERDVDLYLTTFEKVATAESWPRDYWCAILQPLLTGKAQKALANRL